MPFHGPITSRQSEAVEEFCQLYWPPYCWAIYWIPGHPFHRQMEAVCRYNGLKEEPDVVQVRRPADRERRVSDRDVDLVHIAQDRV